MEKMIRKSVRPQNAGLAEARKALLPLVLVALMIACAWWIYGQAGSAYSWQWARVWRYLGQWTDSGFKSGLLLQGLWVTVLLAACSMGFALLAAFVLAFMRLSPSPVLRCAGGAVVSVIRNTPLLIQLFLFYFVVADAAGFNSFASAVFCLAFFEGVYLAEILRGGILSLPPTQWEAGFSLGMSLPKTLRYVILPQVFRNTLPSLCGQLVSLIKDTSLVSAIAVADLTLQARTVISETYLSFEIWIVTAVLYFVLTLFVSVPGAWFMRHHLHKRQR